MASNERLDTVPKEKQDAIRVGARPLLRDEIEEGEPPHLLFADEFGEDPTRAMRMWQWFTAYATEHVQSPLHRAAVLVRRVVTAICAAEHPDRMAVYHRLAFDFRESNHESMGSIAKRFGCTKAAVSKAVRTLQAEYGLPSDGTFNKSPAACAKYKMTNGRNRWNTAKDPQHRGARPPEWLIRKYALGALNELRRYTEQHHAGRFVYDELASDPKMARHLDRCWMVSKLDSWDELEPVIRSMIEGDEPETGSISRGKESIPAASVRGAATRDVFSRDTR